MARHAFPRQTEIRIGEIVVQRSRMGGYSGTDTEVYVYSAFVPTPSIMGGPFSTVTTIGEKWYGQLGTERQLPAALEALPARSEERYTAVSEWHKLKHDQAYLVIEQAFPETLGGSHEMGRIYVTLGVEEHVCAGECYAA